MTRKTIASVLVALAIAAMSALQASAASSLVLLYNGTTGNLSLQNTTSGTLGMQEFTVNTIGSGSANGGFGPPSGRTSGTATNLGYMFTGTNILPPAAAFKSNNNVTAQNTNGRWSTSYAGNVGSNVLELQPFAGWSDATRERGPAGTFWDLGNIAPTGMTQADLIARFLTNPQISPNLDLNFGKFLYQPQIGTNTIIVDDEPVTVPVYGPITLGDVLLTPVPEPSTYAMAFAGLVSCGFSMWRKRRTA